MNRNYPKVMKKDGTLEDFQIGKIQEVISKASDRASMPISQEDMSLAISDVCQRVLISKINSDYIETSWLHNSVLYALERNHEPTFLSYRAYRDYKKKYAKSFEESAKYSEKIVYSGDKENANKDSSINSTKQALIAEGTMKEFMKNFEMKPEWIEAHEQGFIHIHDLGSRYLNQINCCLFDMENLISDGFEMNGVKYTEPNNIRSAWNVIGDVTLNASSQQYGGFTIPEIDTILAKYAKKTFDKYFEKFIQQMDLIPAKVMAKSMTLDDIAQGYQGFEHKLNTVSNALGQTPFVTITFGMNTTMWGREISKSILKERNKGMGEDKVTAIFPKLVFLSRNEINRVSDSPNYDIFESAVECSRTRLYPDYLSFDNPQTNNLAKIYEETGQIVSPMGCRAFLSRAKDPRTGLEVYTGRNNIGAVSLNIPKMALESVKGGTGAADSEHVFYGLIQKYTSMVWDIHLDTYERIGKMKGSTNPLLFCEGGSWRSVGYNEEIKPIIELSTASLGYVGLEEAARVFNNEYGGLNTEEFKTDVIEYLSAATSRASSVHGKLFALYATPAESLVHRFQLINREQYGVHDGVTDLDYMTNSFHVHVSKNINAIDKISIESPYHQISTGGRISYTEFPYAVDSNVLIDSIRYAMSLGLYYGVNVVSSSCGDCGNKGEFETCPICNSDNVTTVVRVCGYLTFSQSKGDTRLNKGKVSETKDRVKHTYV